MRVGLLHPGAMGSALAELLVAAGNEVRWASEQRSAATAARAADARLIDARALAGVCADSDVVLCVCPPAVAVDVADDVAATGFDGCYVDANAIAPARMTAIADRLGASGASVVDGAVLGPVPRDADRTRLYLAGPGAEQVAALFPNDGLLGVIVLPGQVGAASALKMAHAASTKGVKALEALSFALADRLGVAPELGAEWDRRKPGGTAGVRAEMARATPRVGRWIGEMEEISDAAEAAGLPGGIHRALAELFRRWDELQI